MNDDERPDEQRPDDVMTVTGPVQPMAGGLSAEPDASIVQTAHKTYPNVLRNLYQPRTENGEQTVDVYKVDAEIAAKPDRENTQLSPIRTIAGRRGGTLTPLTAERGRELAARRWDKLRKAAHAGVVLGVLGPDTPITEVARLESYVTLTAVQAKIANDIANPYATQAYRNIRAAIGADVGAPERRGAADAPAGGATLTLTLSGDVAAKLAQMLLERRSGGE